jgi:hypothetical protein
MQTTATTILYTNKFNEILTTLLMLGALFIGVVIVHSVEQKSTGLKFHMSRSGSDVRCSCHHNSSRFTFPILAYSWRFSSFITINHTAYILTEDDNTLA